MTNAEQQERITFFHNSFSEEAQKAELRLSEAECAFLTQQFPDYRFEKMDICVDADGKSWYFVECDS